MDIFPLSHFGWLEFSTQTPKTNRKFGTLFTRSVHNFFLKKILGLRTHAQCAWAFESILFHATHVGVAATTPFWVPVTTHFIYKVALVLFIIPPDPPNNARSHPTASESPTSRRAIHSRP